MAAPDEPHDRFSLSKQVILIVKGEDGVDHHYPIQEYKLESSDYFTACLEEEWVEGQTRVIRIGEIDEDIFLIYLRWLHDQAMDEDPYEPCTVGRVCESREIHGVIVITDLYALGLRFLDATFRNAVMSELQHGQLCQWEWDVDDFLHACNQLPERCMLMKWLVEQCMWNTYEEGAEVSLEAASEDLKRLPHFFFYHFCLSSMEHNGRAPLSTCTYHEHISDFEQKMCAMDHGI